VQTSRKTCTRRCSDHSKKPIPLRPCGASIPELTHLAKELKVPVISLSIGNPDANIHGKNENITIEAAERGLKIYSELFS
jgi:acetylornithine deacetylase/succinyl-diaminopimelate desuccinylase-like protein